MNDSNINVDTIPLSIEPRMMWLVNNQRFTDVQFVVGPEKQLVYGHKTIMASGSPVFEKMFFANHNLKMTGDERIEIPDLTSTGFINMLKYIYTNNLEDLDLSELFETYVAGDKYQVYKMSDTIFAYIENILSTSNCCIIYDQLMKFPTEYAVPLDKVKYLIRNNSQLAFENKYFVNISEETLVDLLSIDGLSMKEIDVLKSCAMWVDEENKRLNLELNQRNKQMIFKPIKNFIRFSEITFDELKNFDQIGELLSSDELGSLLLHLLNISKFKIECVTPRLLLELKSAFCNKYNRSIHQQNFSEFSLVFKASKRIYITNICTFLSKTVQGLEFSMYDMENGQKVELNYEKLCSQSDNLWSFQFIDSVSIDSTRNYRFIFKFHNSPILYNQLSQDTEMTLEVEDESLVCNLKPYNARFHCLKQMDFHLMS